MENIKTNYKKIENIELNGIELYFEEIPTSEERTILKNIGYRWNKVKKCWYIKKSKLKETKEINLGVEEMENSYSGYGWQGVNSKQHLSIVEIAKIIKKELKKKYPNAVFSVTSGGNCYCNTLDIALVKDIKNPLNTYEDAVKEAERSPSRNTKIIEDYSKWVGLTERDIQESEEAKKHLKNRLESKHITLNQYYIKDDYELSIYGKELFQYVKNLCDSFNYDDSDSMTDYFDCGFYLDLKIGKWNKPFELIKKEIA